MDDTPTPGRRGGTVEPLRQPANDKHYPPPTLDPPGRTYELRDPFNDTTHRADSFDKMVVKAEQAGAIRFTAVDADGKRTPVHKVEGAWERPPAPAPYLVITDKYDLAWLGLRGKNGPKAREEPTQDGRESPAKGQAPTLAQASARAPQGTEQAASAATPREAGAQRGAPAERNRTETAVDRAAHIAQLDQGLHERYIVKRALLKIGEIQLGTTEYRFKGDTARVAFTEGRSRLSTDLNTPSVARSMVDVAEMRGWKGLRVAGNEDFRRAVWLEATVRGVRTQGYEPLPQDLEMLAKARQARQVNQVERTEPEPQKPAAKGPVREAPSGADAPAAATKGSARGSGGRKVVLAAIEALLVDRKVPQKQREAVMAAAAESLGRRQAAGQTHKVKVYDAQAPRQREVAQPTQERQRGREMPGPAPAR